MERIINPVFWTNRAIKDLEKVTRFNMKLFGFKKAIEIASEIQEATEILAFHKFNKLGLLMKILHT